LLFNDLPGENSRTAGRIGEVRLASGLPLISNGRLTRLSLRNFRPIVARPDLRFPASVPVAPVEFAALGDALEPGAAALSRRSLRIDAPNIDIRRTVKTAAGVRSGIGVASQRTPASREQYSQPDDDQCHLVHRVPSLPEENSSHPEPMSSHKWRPPISTPNSSACRSAFQGASWGTKGWETLPVPLFCSRVRQTKNTHLGEGASEMADRRSRSTPSPTR
jgi:hypothetical protein